MYLIRGLKNIPAWRRQFPNRRCVATMGNFDGVHPGHRQLIERMQNLARENGWSTLVTLFEPHPREFLDPESAPSRLMGWRDKVEAIWQAGIDTVMVVHFNDRLRQLSPADFIRQVFEPLAPGHLVVGDDQRFGVNRSGGLDDLRHWGEQNGIGIESIPTVLSDGERVSSTRVRQALRDGNLPLATELLGHPWSFTGRVLSGRRIGRSIGFPTANLNLPPRRLVIPGVYAVRVQLANGERHDGVVNLGTRPTFDGKHLSLEVHLLDFDGDIYGQRIRLEFIEKLREEQRFPDVQALKAQIAADVERARAVLS